MMRMFRLHFNKVAERRGDPLVWSVQTSAGCFHAAHVVITGRIETENKPERKSNPRYFLAGRGRVDQVGDTIFIKGAWA